MTLFINLRATTVGGLVASHAEAWDDGVRFVSPEAFARRVEGRDLVLASHGFNVDQRSGIDALSLWQEACALPASSLFIGVLWPGDSRMHVFVDYVYEGVEAIASGKLLAAYLDANGRSAATRSFSAHSLGARMVLETVRNMVTPVRKLALMASAIENDCLNREYRDVALKVEEITVVASRSDAVLQWAFPAGNLIGEIMMHGHPYDRTALGRDGPARPAPPGANVDPWQIPQGWDYGHLDYLPNAQMGPASPLPPPVVKPVPDMPAPCPGTRWKPAWSAGVLATKVR